MKTGFAFNISLIYFIIVSLSASSQVAPDTTKLLADNQENSQLAFLIKPANVFYPSSLEKDRDQSIEYVQNFSEKKRDYLVWIYNNGKEYFSKISDVFKSYSLPEELKVLIALESGFKGNVVSRSGAVGYWQMMAAAAKHYGLNISGSKHGKLKDERKDFEKSTIAAAKFLSDCAEDLNNNILLIAASYNCGAGRILSAIKKSGIANPDFWDIKKYLPSETRNYVMNFIALNVILGNYENFSKKELVFIPEYSANTESDNIIIPPVNTD